MRHVFLMVNVVFFPALQLSSTPLAGKMILFCQVVFSMFTLCGHADPCPYHQGHAPGIHAFNANRLA